MEWNVEAQVKKLAAACWVGPDVRQLGSNGSQRPAHEHSKLPSVTLYVPQRLFKEPKAIPADQTIAL